MSLFRLKEWWSESPRGEQFGDGGMVVGNVDNSPENKLKIVTGSLQGKLCVYDPQLTRAPGGSRALLEAKMDAPIYQLEIGRLISGCRYALAILHPSKLVVCSCTSCDAKSQASSFETSPFELIFHYVHKFKIKPSDFNAYSMCVGLFGSTNDHDMILVQAMNGRVTTYDFEVMLCPFVRISTYFHCLCRKKYFPVTFMITWRLDP